MQEHVAYGRSTEFQLPLPITAFLPCAGYNLNNHKSSSVLLPPCAFHGKFFEKDIVFLFLLVQESLIRIVSSGDCKAATKIY